MTSKDNAPDEELLARYRQASDADAAGPSDAVRAAILAESRRVAEQLAKQAPQHPFDVSRPAANDSRWKITAFGTLGAALLAALLIAPRYWESRPTTQVSSAPAAKSASSDATAPAPATVPAPQTARAPAAAPAPKMESIAPSPPNETPQEVVVTQADRKAKARAEESRRYAAPAPSNPPSVAQNYVQAPPSPPQAANSVAPLLAPAPEDVTAGVPVRAARGAVVSMSADRAARASGVPTPASLQSAAGLGDLAQAASLLDQGVAVDARDETGRTPLMLAVVQGRLEVVRLLLARGADPNAADNMGRTPLQQAKERNLRDVAALLEQAGAH